MRTLTTAILAGSVLACLGPLAASAADLDDFPPPPPPPYYERGPVPPAFVPDRVAPVVVRPVIYPRPIYPRVVRPYGYYGPRPVVRVYGERAYGFREPRDYGDDYSRPLPPRVERDREDFGRDRYGYEPGSGRREDYGSRDGGRYGHCLSHDELERRAERGREGYGHDRSADRDRGDGRDDRFADRGPGRDFDR